MGKKVNLFLSLLLGFIIFGFFLYRVGAKDVFSIFSNMSFVFLGAYFLFTTLTFFPTAWRWKVVLNAHGSSIPFFSLVKYTIAGYAVNYVTPSSRLGGEPLRAYMLNKEHKVNLKKGASSIIIEKFVELSGSLIFGIFGMFLFFSLPSLASWLKIVIGVSVLICSIILIVFYYRGLTGKGSFSSLFLFLRLNRISKWKDFVHTIEEVEAYMQKFFLEHKREFLLAFFTYFVYGVLVILEFKFLLLGLGFNESLRTIILAIIVAGFAGFVPVPADLGFLEAGQSSLFSAIRGRGSIGFALSIIARVRALIFVAVGFSIITYFSGKQFLMLKRKLSN